MNGIRGHIPPQSTKGLALLGFTILFAFVWLAQSSWSFGQGPNNRNVTVDTTVNITGSAPVISAVTMQPAIILSAGSTTVLACNVSVYDYNSFNDIGVVNATLYSKTVAASAADDNNTHYSNSSCAFVAGNDIYANYTCTFAVRYYAVNGTWNCSAHVNDSLGLSGTGIGNTTISPVYALNVSMLLDYGNLSAGSYSNQSVNVSNLGNMNINLSVQGYGRNLGDGLSFACDQGNLSAGLQHFAANSTADFVEKQTLTGSLQRVRGLTVIKTSMDAVSQNATYWELYVDPLQSAYGRCNGTIVFQAETV